MWGVDPLAPYQPGTINPFTIQLNNSQVVFTGSDRIDKLYLKLNDNQELAYSNDGVSFFTDLNPVTAQKNVFASFTGINFNIDLKGGNDSLYLDTSLITALKQYGSTLTFDGGEGQDTLFGPAINTTWNITGLNTVNFDAVNFNHIENLTGAANNEDTFVFSENGSLSGIVDASAGGFDTLVINGGNYSRAVYTATSPDAGSITLDNKLITYAGLEPIVDNTVVSDRTFDGTANDDQIVLEKDASGKNKISSSNNTFESIVFLNPSNSLTINAGKGQDTITVKSVDSDFSGNLTIDGQDNGASGGAGNDGFLDTGLFVGDTVTFSEDFNVNLRGKGLSVNAEKIVAEKNVVISTTNPKGNSGAITFTGENIELKTGVQIFADAASGFTAGDITITADESQNRLGSEPYGVNLKNISVTIADGSIFKGGKIAISSTAADISVIDLAPAYSKDVLIKPFAQLLPQAFNAVLPASVQYRSASAIVTISGAKITGSADVSITATTKVDSSVQAISSINPINPLSRAAIAYGQAETTAKVEIQGVVNSGVTNKTEIIGKQGVTILSDATTKDEVTARVFGNEGLLGKVPVNAEEAGFAIAVANSNTTSKAIIGKDVNITSDEGNIKVNAKGKISNVAKATSNVFVNGTAGIGIGLNFDRSDIVAEVNGTLTAVGKKEVNQEIDLTKVNNTDDTIALLDHGLKTDDEIQYFTNGGIAIGGLTEQQKYYVLVKDKDTIQLSKALGIELDNSGVAANSQQGFSKRDSKEFNIKTDIDFNTNQIKIVNHGFVTGQKINYNSLLADPLDTKEGNTSGTLTNSNIDYYIIKDDNDRFRLATSRANATVANPIAIDLVKPDGTSTNTNSLSSILFTQAAKQFNPAGDAVKDNIVTLNNHGFVTGDTVVYNVDGTISTTTNVAVNNTFDPATAVNATKDTIAITAHGLKTGDKVTYLTNYVGQPGTGINTLTNGVTGSLINGIDYYIIKVDDNTVKLATSAANAIAGTAINLTGGGTGVYHNLRINREVTAGDTAIGGLQDGDTYYVSVIDANHFRLADSEVQARDAAPINIDSTGATANTTKQAFAKPENLSQGIGILADLTANDRVGVTGKTGSNPKIKDLIANADVLSAVRLFDFADFKNNLKAIPGSSSANNFSIGAGLGLNWVQHDGTTAKVGSTARLQSNKDVTITAQVKQETQMIVDTSTGKDEAGTSVSVSVGVAIYKNIVNAIVDSNAEIDARGAVKVTSTLTYPFLFIPTEKFNFSSDDLKVREQAGANVFTLARDVFLDGKFGIPDRIMNTFVTSRNKGKVDATKGGIQPTIGIAGSFGINTYNNVSQAIIKSGAKINQNSHYQTDTQSVAVNATTSISLLAQDSSWIISLGGALGVGSNAGVGAAVGYNQISSNVRTYLEGSTLNLAGGLTLNAISKAQIQGVTVGVGVGKGASGLGGAGSASINLIKNTIDSHISTNSKVTTGGAIAVKAKDSSLIVSISGGVAASKNAAVGASISYNLIQNNIQSYVDNSIIRGTTSTEITATDSALLAAVSVGGAGAQGFALGGSLTVNSIANSVDAHISGAADVVVGGDLTLTATEASSLYAISGGVALSLGGAAVGAAIAYNYVGGSFDYANPNAIDRNSTNKNKINAYIDNSKVNVGNNLSIVSGFQAPTNPLADKPTLTSSEKTFNPATSVNVNTNVIDFGSTHGFSNGQGIVYHNNGGTSIDGLGEGNTYYVVKVDDNKIKLATTSDYAIKAANGESVPNDAIVDLKSLGSGNNHKFTAQQVDVGITSIALPVDFSSQITTVTVGGAGADSFALGGALSLNFLRNSVDARITNIGSTQSVTAGGKLSILTNDSSQSNSGTGGIGISPGGGAIGASISYNEISNKLISRIGSLDTSSTTDSNAGIISASQIEVNTTSSAKIYNFTVAGAGAGTFALGGSFSLNRIDNTVDAHIAGSSNVASTQGINIKAEDTSSNQSLSGQVAIGVGTAGVGVALAYNEINNTINAYVDRSTINTTNSANLGITAKSNATIGTIAAGIAGGGIAGVAGSIAVNLMGNNVSAFITNSTVNVDGNVSLLADSTNSIGAIGGTLAVGGVVGIGGSVVVNTTNNKTKAYIAGKSSVSAKGNGNTISVKKWNTDENGTETTENINGLSVIATTNETVNTYAATAGVTPPTGGASVGIGANVVVEVINDITEAYIDDSNINSAANKGKSVKVRAHNDTTIGNFGGSLGVGDVGVGADIPVSVITSQTRAYISDSDPTTHAVVFGATDVEVNALSREKLQTVAVGLGIGSYVGAAGVGAGTKSATTTEAYIKEADINSNGALKVLANSGVKLEIYGGALGGSIVAGGGGSFAVSLINNTTNAYMQGAVTNTGSVQVQADSTAKISNAIATAGAGGVVGIAGGVSVVETNGNTSAYISSGTRNSNVTANTGDVKVIANDTVDVNNGVGSGAAAGIVGVSASVDVITIKNTVDAHIGDNSTVTAQTNVNVEATGKKNIDSTVVAFGLAGGAAITGAVSVINIGTGSNSDASSSTSPVQAIIDGITSPTSGINGLSKNTNDTTATKARNQTNSAYFTVSLAANSTTTGTTAYIGKNVNVKANTGNITAIANETVDLDGSHPATNGQLVGGVSLGLYGSAGGSVGIINIGQVANAYIDAGATLAAGADITVNAKFTNNAFSRAYGGTGALGVGLGAQVAIINDNSTQLAYTSNQGITVNQANTFTVKAESDRTINTEAKGATVGAVAAGAAVAKSVVGGSTVAYIGNNAAIGQEVGKNVNNVSVIANNFSTAKSETLAVAAGIVGVNVDVNQTTINPTITATIGGGANLKITGNLNISANSQADADVNSFGISAGGAAVGIVQPEAKIASTINAAIGAGVVLSAGGAVNVEALHNIKSDGTLIAKSSRSRGNASAGALLAGTGALAKANSSATVGVGVGDNSNLQATGNIFLNSRVNNDASTNGISNSGGILGAGIIKAATDITTVNNAVIGNDVVIQSSSDFQLLADSTNKGEVIADRAGGGVVDVSRADVDLTFNDRTATNVGNRASIKAKNNLTVQAQMQTSTGTNKASVSNGGLGVDTRANNNTNLTANTTTSVNGSLNASNVTLRADVKKIGTKAETSAKGYGLGTGVYTTATNNTTSNVTVNVLEQANIRGLDKVTIGAKQNNLDTQSYALGEGNSLGGNTDVTTNTDLKTNTTVNAKAGSVISTFELFVEANAPATPIFSADSSRKSATIDTGSEKENPTLGLLRTIDFNSTVNIFGAKVPVLEIDANGNVVQQKNVSFTQNATDIIVNDIKNSGSLSGSVTFLIASSTYDDGNTRKGELKGSPKFDFATTFDRVDIINRSTKNLTINNIDVFNNSSQLTSNITIAVPVKSAFTPITTSSTSATLIAIANTNTSGTAKINLSGNINNRFGTTSVINNGGDILAPNAGKSIESTAVTLQSDNGAIGTTTNRVTVKPTTLLATAKNDIFVNTLTGGDLTIKQVISTTGDVTLDAVGSILDGNATGVDVSGKKVSLTSQTGSIGSDSDAIEITASDASTGLSAIAQNNINLINVGDGGFSIGQVNSTAGNITLTIPDSINAGQNLTLLDTAIISADAGNVILNVGDNVSTTANSQIRGKTQVTINADLGIADAGQGANLDLNAKLSATSVQINTGDDVDVIALTNSTTNTTTTINAGGGNNKIFLGSKATSAGNSNGLLDNFLGQVIVQGGTGSDLLELNDYFDTKVNTGNLSNTQITGLGMAFGVQYAGIETLNVILGTGKDTFNAQSTQDGTETIINTGGGDNTINVGNNNQLNAINGLLIIRGNAGYDILNINDTGDTVANKGILDSYRLTGLGMGSTDQTAINAGRGISFGGLEKVNLNLGNGVDELTVAGANTETIVNAGQGADIITVGNDLSRISARVLLQGGTAGNKILNINSTPQSDITIDTLGNNRDVLTIASATGKVEYEAFNNVNLTQSAGNDKLTIKDVTQNITVNTNGGDDVANIVNSHSAIAINTSAGNDIVTVNNVDGALTVNGDTAGTNKLIIDLANTTKAITNGLIKNGTVANQGIAQNFTTGDIIFTNLKSVETKLGSGNDQATINNTLTGTAIAVNGGGGDDAIKILSIGTDTNIAGGSEQDTVTVEIKGLPVANSFSKLNLDVENLIVDNTQNTTNGINWTITDGATVTAAIAPNNVSFDVINTQGAALTRILGGTQSDTLNLVTTTTGNINGVINGNRVELISGQVVLVPKSSGILTNYDAAINFDSLANNSAKTFKQASFTLTSTGNILRDDAISPAAKATNTDDTFTLTSNIGAGFGVYSLQLANSTAIAQTITFTGTTLNGGTVSYNYTVAANSSLTTVTLPTNFVGITSLKWNPGVTLVDNIVALNLFSNSATGTEPNATIPVLTLAGKVRFDTNRFFIYEDCNKNGIDETIYADGVSYESDDNSGVLLKTTAFNLFTSNSNSITQFRFAGNINFDNDAVVSGIGSNGLSVFAGNDVTVGSKVVFDFSAVNTIAGVGGGGGASTGGQGGSTTAGGTGATANGTGGAGGAGGGKHKGRGGTANIGDNGADGGDGTAIIGGSGLNGNNGINGGTGGTSGGSGQLGTSAAGGSSGVGGDYN